MKYCDWCGERLMCGEAWLIPCIGGPKKYVLYHYECHMRQFLGSLAHVEKRCGCYVPGAEETDPPGMSLRDAARAAVAAFEKASGQFPRPPRLQ